jgi:hypothetical protein
MTNLQIHNPQFVELALKRELREYLARKTPTFSYLLNGSERVAWNAGPLPGLALI